MSAIDAKRPYAPRIALNKEDILIVVKSNSVISIDLSATLN